VKRAITLEFDDFGWAALREEADRQAVTVEELLEHAAMYYLSDLDTGRVAARILRRAEIEDAEDDPGTVRRFDRPDEPEES
jgi:hypothetical protein